MSPLRRLVGGLLCAALIIGSVTGVHLHICLDAEETATSVHTHSDGHPHQHLILADHGHSDLDIQPFLALLNPQTDSELPPALPPAAAPVQRAAAVRIVALWAGEPPPTRVARAIRPPLRAPPALST